MSATQPASQPANSSLCPPVIHPLTPRHAADAARLHILGQPGTFLTSLGADLLALFYRTLPVSPVGFGFAALNGENRTLGFAAVTTSTGHLFVEMATRRLGQLLPPLLTAFARRPSLLLRAGQTLLYHSLTGRGADGGDFHAELLLAIMTGRCPQPGESVALCWQSVRSVARRGMTEQSVTVDAANSGARRFLRETPRFFSM